MPTDFHEDDVKRVWQNQPGEESKVSTVLIRQKSHDLRARTRKQLLGSLAAPFVVVFFYVFAMTYLRQLGPVTHSVFLAALVWSIAGVYLLNQERWGRTLPQNVGLHSGIEFCRLELKRQQGYLSRAVLCSFAPIVLAIGGFSLAVFGATGIAFLRAIPFLIVVVLWIPSYFYLRSHQGRGVQREIDELGEVSEPHPKDKGR
jgi:fatty acid desaturase